MWDCFEEALAVYKEECSNHKEMYRGMEKSIKRMEDEEARGSLTAALDSVFEDDLENLKTSYPIFIRWMILIKKPTNVGFIANWHPVGENI